MNGIKSRAQDGYAQVRRSNIDMLAPSLDEYLKTRHQFKRTTQVVQIHISVYLEFNWYDVLLRGMHHIDRYSFISAHANPCEF